MKQSTTIVDYLRPMISAVHRTVNEQGIEGKEAKGTGSEETVDIAPQRMRQVRSREPQRERACTVLPYRTAVDRRAAVYELLGAEPSAYHAESWTPSMYADEPVHVYLDVSGSMEPVLPLVYAVLRPLLPLIHRSVHLFSTVVRDVRPTTIRNGIAVTTGGTNIDCVCEHIRGNRVRRAVVITDGEFDDVAAELHGARVNSVVTTPGETGFVECLPGRVFVLPALEEE